MEALVLSGGIGSRLQPLLGDCPKALAPLGGRPFLDYLLLQLKRHGVAEVILCLGYGVEAIVDHVARHPVPGLRVRCSVEPEPLGTAGALKWAEPMLTGSEWLVMNGDSLFAIDLQALVCFHHDRAAVATLALAQVEDAERFGSVEVDARGAVQRFLEKGRRGPGCISGGLYVLSRAALAQIPVGRSVSLEYEVFPRLIGAGLFGMPCQGSFADIGVPDAYRRVAADAGRWQALLAEEAPC